MKSVLVVALALCLGALVPVLAIPAILKENYHPYRLQQLQKPDEESASKAIHNVIYQPMPQAKAAEGVQLSPSEGRIMYGNFAAANQFPYQVALIIQTSGGQYFCGGSFITKRWVLTAAHCVPNDVQWILVFACSTKWASAPVQAYATRVFWHGNYDADWLHNDITLLDLGQELNYDCVQPVDVECEGCGDGTLDWQSAVVSGWGRTEDEAYVVEDLRYVDTLTVSNANCSSYYISGLIIESTICSVNPEGLPGVLCSGDSGGPLVWHRTGRQIGINSFVSSGGCDAGPPSGYARVPCFCSWIEYVKTL